ncbi:T-complex protein 1 subunit zeta-like [Oopsacas minuta]|uniref:T-complex protein 1 subunit zeta-like n=1 Tax=Oopsacas minuta TaxID=111878 RepID=A0AAV7JH93_9METZ|nr:T-complex protein 1 subunit zeta-like [Oopsacas minuta]
MTAIKELNPNAEIARAGQALLLNVNAAKGLQEVMRTNLGPKGTMKMLVSGSGDIKITKDGNVLLHEMQIQHPTASLIARTSTAQDQITGDGTTSNVLLIGELLKQAEYYVSEGLHPRVATEGFDLAKIKALEVLDLIRVKIGAERHMLINVARTSLRTKVKQDLADLLTEVVVDAVLAIKREDFHIDLHMIEIMEMMHQTELDTKLIYGIVTDHGGRHPDMPRRIDQAFVLTCNVSMEYEKSEINSSFVYKSSDQRERLVLAERKFTDEKVQRIIDLKKKVCSGPNSDKGFLVLNQKGIDPLSLDMLAKENILGLRRVKRRNMERLMLACGGEAMNSVDDELTSDCLGYAGVVYQHTLGEDTYTFIEDVKNPASVTILIKGPNNHSIVQIKDAIHDGLRAVMNAIEDECIIPGAGAFEIAAHSAIIDPEFMNDIKGKAKLGAKAFADALLITPKCLAQNAGLDPQDIIVKLQQEYSTNKFPVGLDIYSGDAQFPIDSGIFDNYRVKRQLIQSATAIASNLLLVDEVMRAGMSSLKQAS